MSKEKTFNDSVNIDFSAVNNFIDEESRRVKQVRRRRTANIFKKYLLYFSLLLISIGIFIVFLALSYWLFFDKPNQIVKVDGDQTYNTSNYNLSQDIDRLEQIVKDQKKLNETEKIEQNVKEEYIIFRSREVLLSNNFKAEIHTGYKFKPENINYPYSQYCYFHNKERVWIDLMQKEGKKLPTSYSSNNQSVSLEDFNKAKSFCIFRN